MNGGISDICARLDLARLQVHFQPVVNLRTGDMVGVEALLRPVGEDGAMVSPGIIFERAARMGLLLELEREARELALHEFHAQEPPAELLLFLNFSAALLDDGRLDPGRIHATVVAEQLATASIAIEIVESGVSSQEQLAAFAARNRAAGFLIVLDDFGTEHSNLERVALVRPDVIKIDRSITSGAAGDPIKQSILRSIAYLARTIGALSLAEGIEEYEDLLVCAREGVELAQGFYLGRPAESLAHARKRQMERLHESLAALRADLSAQLRAASQVVQATVNAVGDIVAELSACTRDTAEDCLRRRIKGSPFSCAYLVDEDGVQCSETLFVQSAPQRDRHPVFQPATRGTNHSLKDYVYGPLAQGRQDYVTHPYVSLASGHLCRTFSRRFTTTDGHALLLCVDTEDRGATL